MINSLKSFLSTAENISQTACSKLNIRYPKSTIAICVITAIILYIRKVITDNQEFKEIIKISYDNDVIKLSSKDVKRIKNFCNKNPKFVFKNLCAVGFKGNGFLNCEIDFDNYARIYALTDKNFNPNGSKKFFDVISINVNSKEFKELKYKEELKGKGCVIPALKNIIVFENKDFKEIMLKEAKSIYGEGAKITIGWPQQYDCINIKLRRDDKSNLCTFLGNFGYKQTFMAHKDNDLDPYMEEIGNDISQLFRKE